MSRQVGLWPGWPVTLLTLTLGQPGPELAERFKRCRAAMRNLVQALGLSGWSVVEATQPQAGTWHVHVHAVVLGSFYFDLEAAREKMRTFGFGTVFHVSVKPRAEPMLAARYLAKYVSKGSGVPWPRGSRLLAQHGRAFGNRSRHHLQRRNDEA